MYHFSHESLLHHNSHNEYQRYSFVNEKPFVPINQNLTEEDGGKQQNVDVQRASESQIPSSDKTLVSTKEKKISCKKIKKSPVDTSSFTVEERAVAAVWMHERKNTKCSISQIKRDFRQRFGREPPAKNTLLVWERKLFSTGSVHDAPRPGRPIKHGASAAAALSSVQRAPALSLRARARALAVPRTTLRTILLRDLAHSTTVKKDTPGKQSRKAMAKKPLQHTLPCESHPTSGLHYFQGYT